MYFKNIQIYVFCSTILCMLFVWSFQIILSIIVVKNNLLVLNYFDSIAMNIYAPMFDWRKMHKKQPQLVHALSSDLFRVFFLCQIPIISVLLWFVPLKERGTIKQMHRQTSIQMLMYIVYRVTFYIEHIFTFLFLKFSSHIEISNSYWDAIDFFLYQSSAVCSILNVTL